MGCCLICDQCDCDCSFKRLDPFKRNEKPRKASEGKLVMAVSAAMIDSQRLVKASIKQFAHDSIKSSHGSLSGSCLGAVASEHSQGQASFVTDSQNTIVELRKQLEAFEIHGVVAFS